MKSNSAEDDLGSVSTKNISETTKTSRISHEIYRNSNLIDMPRPKTEKKSSQIQDSRSLTRSLEKCSFGTGNQYISQNEESWGVSGYMRSMEKSSSVIDDIFITDKQFNPQHRPMDQIIEAQSELTDDEESHSPYNQKTTTQKIQNQNWRVIYPDLEPPSPVVRNLNPGRLRRNFRKIQKSSEFKCSNEDLSQYVEIEGLDPIETDPSISNEDSEKRGQFGLGNFLKRSWSADNKSQKLYGVDSLTTLENIEIESRTNSICNLSLNRANLSFVRKMCYTDEDIQNNTCSSEDLRKFGHIFKSSKESLGDF